MELAWGTQHFRLRFAHAALALRQVRADGDAKSAGVADCAELRVEIDGAGALLPADATLVAAREVEFDELGIALPVLAFQVVHDAADEAAQERSRGPKKRRRGDSGAVCTLYFFLLRGQSCSDDNNKCELQFVNSVDVMLPSFFSPAINSQDSGRAGTLSVQVHITHGPHVVVSAPHARELSIMKFRSEDTRFVVWCAGVKLLSDADDVDNTVCRVVSCEFVSDDESDAPHLLTHFVNSTASSSELREPIHCWSLYPLSGSVEGAAMRACTYLPHLEQEQVNSCLVVRRQAAIWTSDDSFNMWQPMPSASLLEHRPIALAPSTLLVVGTTRSTLYVYDCGVLLLSFVLPTPPNRLFQVQSGDVNQSIVFLGVQCNDANRSFYLLSFDTRLDQPSMSIVHAFSHVGSALVGEFSRNCCADEILLINHVEEDQQAATNTTSANEQLVVKKCVLICKKYGSEKFTIHRLRASQLEGKTDAPKARGSKRSRSTRDTEDATAVPMRYIERIKFGSKDHGSGNNERAGCEDKSAAVSQSQLVQLTKSLETRVANGIHELDRMQLVVVDKRGMVRRLNGFVIEQWWTATQTLYSEIGRLPVEMKVRVPSDVNHGVGGASIKLDALVSTTTPDNSHGDDDATLSSEFELESFVSLSKIDVETFIPSASVVRLKVVLRNRSSSSLRNAYVAFVSRASDTHSGVLTELHASSSVCSQFHCESDQQDGMATFLVDVVLPPSIALLRTQRAFNASLWLHFSIQEHQQGNTKLTGLHGRNAVTAIGGGASESSTWSNDCPCFVAPVAIPLREIVHSHEQSVAPRLRQPMKAARETEELLVLSSGSSLLHILHDNGSSTGGTRRDPVATAMASQRSVVPTIVRPTFALVSLAAAERDLANFYLSELLSSLPRDVFTMINPLRRHHLLQLQGLLNSIRMELTVLQRHSVALPNGASVAEAGGGDEDVDMSSDGDSSTGASSHEPHQQWQLLTAFRQLQMETDLSAVRLLRSLQKRANYHSVWHAAA